MCLGFGAKFVATMCGGVSRARRSNNQTNPLSIYFQIAPGQEQFAPQLNALAQTFAHSGETIYKARNEIKRMQWHDAAVIVKSFAVPRGLRGYIYGQLRKSKARRSFENALELQRRGISTPAPIGFIEHAQGGALKQSFYVCHEWPASFTLREPLFDLEFPKRLEILQMLGRFAWQLHSKEIYHRDFSPGNILITADSVAAETISQWNFSLVDVNRMQFAPLSLKQRMRNFAMLWAREADLKIIVQAYAQESGDAAEAAVSLALGYSAQHKKKAMRKERIKSLLGLH